ncbi:MAG: histidine phosphatase family protein [Fusobacterium sp.]|nr:histidine phosphatase family protein [Fusobacterium sp.]
MGRLILIRHGQTEMNKQKLYFGKLNPKLNNLGIEQAQNAKKYLEEIKEKISYDLVYSSPLLRAKETAEICNYLEKNIIFDKNLEELNFGIFEGLTYKEILEKFPNEAKKMENSWLNYNYETGESPKEMYERVINFVENLDFSKNILIVSHWGVINSILSHFLSKELEAYWKFSVRNGGVAILNGDKNFCFLEKLI